MNGTRVGFCRFNGALTSSSAAHCQHRPRSPHMVAAFDRCQPSRTSGLDKKPTSTRADGKSAAFSTASGLLQAGAESRSSSPRSAHPRDQRIRQPDQLRPVSSRAKSIRTVAVILPGQVQPGQQIAAIVPLGHPFGRLIHAPRTMYKPTPQSPRPASSSASACRTERVRPRRAGDGHAFGQGHEHLCIARQNRRCVFPRPGHRLASSSRVAASRPLPTSPSRSAPGSGSAMTGINHHDQRSPIRGGRGQRRFQTGKIDPNRDRAGHPTQRRKSAADTACICTVNVAVLCAHGHPRLPDDHRTARSTTSRDQPARRYRKAR